MDDNVKKLTLKGLFWNAIDRFGNQIVVTVVGIITARLLSVSDFAVLAVLSVFSTVATSFVDSGLATSLVRSKEVDEDDYASMFVFNLIVSTVIYLILFLSAPVIERFYGITNLALYARVLFLQLIVHALGIVQYVKVLKRSQFNITARVNVISVFLSGVIAVLLAYFNFGVWVLILQPILYSSFRSGMFWYWGDWKIRFTMRKASINKHLRFSLSFMTANLLGKILAPLYSSFIGKYYSTVQTGYYYQANKWGETPNLLISSIIQGTTLSTLAPIQDDFLRFLNACRKTISTLAFILFPVSLLAISVAKAGFIIILTEKYLHAVPYFQLLCLGGVFISLTDLNVNFVNIKGKSRYALFLEILKISLAVLSLLITYKNGIFAIIIGQLTVRMLCFLVASIISQRIYGYRIFMQIKDIIPSFVISATAAVLSYLPQYVNLTEQVVIMFILQTFIFGIVYLSLNHITKNVIWLEIWKLIKDKLKKNRNGNSKR